MENGGASYSPQTTKTQTAEAPQSSYNMPSASGGVGPPSQPAPSSAVTPPA